MHHLYLTHSSGCILPPQYPTHIPGLAHAGPPGPIPNPLPMATMLSLYTIPPYSLTLVIPVSSPNSYLQLYVSMSPSPIDLSRNKLALSCAKLRSS